MCRHIDCLVCGSGLQRVLYESNIDKYEEEIDPKDFSVLFADRRHGRIVKCKRCGFVFVNPHENESKFFKAYEGLAPTEYLHEKENRLLIFEENIRLIEQFCKKRGKLLDLGCSVGLFLYTSKNKGWNVKGLEASKLNAAYARTEFGLDVLDGDIEDFDFGKEVFDVITMWDLLEHLQNPDIVLSKVHSLLRNNGICALSTPDIESTFAKVMGEKWEAIVRCHLYYFSEETLTSLLNKFGFRIVFKTYYRRIFSLKYLLKKLEENFRPLSCLGRLLLERAVGLGKIRIPINVRDELLVIAKKM